MRTRWLSRLTVVGCAGLLWAASACVVGDTRTVNAGYGYGYASASASAGVGVGEPSTATVSSLPPEPLYEQMTVSPGFGYVWIDGYWHWNSYEWVWVSGRWVREQGAAYVYVQPSYDYASGAYVYRPGYWASRDRVPTGWNVRDHRDGRPAVVAPPPAAMQPPPVGAVSAPAAARVRDHRTMPGAVGPADGAYSTPARRGFAPPPPRTAPAGSAGPTRVRDHRNRR
jgi:hypothetical protein